MIQDHIAVFNDKGAEEWRVFFGGRLCKPMWRQKGPAQAYLSGLQAGTRTPEYGDDP